jgi:hypothetical protein
MLNRKDAEARAAHYRQQYLDAHYSDVEVLERAEPHTYFIVVARRGPIAVNRTVKFKE